ncbi:MAG: hypothetical protein ACRD44_07810 [Bryobacteraceae bacterium]
MKSFIFWEHKRASWQYDVMVGLILAFIFLTPRGWFRDQPKPKSVVMLPAEHGAHVFWIDADLLTDTAEGRRSARAQQLIRSQSEGKKHHLVRLEPIFDAEQEIRGFMAFARLDGKP